MFSPLFPSFSLHHSITQYVCKQFPILYVLVPPKDVMITDPSGMVIRTTILNPVIEGQPLQLICTAYGGNYDHR